MKTFLTRIAWIVSFLLWYFVAWWMLQWIDVRDDFILLSFILGCLFAAVVKWMFLSESMIDRAIAQLTNSVSQTAQANMSKVSEINHHTTKISVESTKVENGLIQTNESIPEYNYSYQNDRFYEPVQQKSVAVSQSKTFSQPIKHEQSRFWLYIKNFFAVNALAKIGGILLFLWAFFFVSLIYVGVGWIGKMIIWLGVGLFIYAVWIYFDRKKLWVESQICLGVGILINFFVILSGRYLIGWNLWEWSLLLSQGTTFIMLICNTLLAVITWMIYRSNTLLLFSFVCAFLNPLLVWWEATDPYTVWTYAFVVALGAIYLSKRLAWEPNMSLTLLRTAFVWWMWTLLFAETGSVNGWIFKLLWLVILWIITTYMAYRQWLYRQVLWFVLWTYVSLLWLIGPTFGWMTQYWMTLVANVVLWVWVIGLMHTQKCDKLVSLAMLIPFVWLTIILCQYQFASQTIVPGLLFACVTVVVWLWKLWQQQSDSKTIWISYGLISWTVWFVAIFGFFTWIFSNSGLSLGIHTTLTQWIVTIAVSFLILILWYLYAQKDKMEWLYPLATLGHIAVILPVIHSTLFDGYEMLWYGIVLLTVLLWLLVPIIIERVRNSTIAMMLWLIVVALFAGWEIYYLDSTRWLGLVAGFLYIALAIAYFVPGFYSIYKNPDNSRNIIYTYLWISLSSLAIAMWFIFSERIEILSLSWLFMWIIIMYFYSRIKDLRIYLASIILFAIWLVKLGSLIWWTQPGEYMLLVPLMIVLCVMTLWLYFMKDDHEEYRLAYDVANLAWLWILWVLLSQIIPNTWHGWSTLAMTSFVLILTLLYRVFNTWYTKYILMWITVLVACFGLTQVNEIFDNLTQDKMLYLRVLQYISTAILWVSAYLQYKKEPWVIWLWLMSIISLYAFVATTLFVYNIFDNTFVITIYWWILSYLVLQRWISKDMIRYRTIGLYIISLTIAKIFLYDIWYSIDDVIVRVLALMFMWWLLIFISSLYSKKYGWDMKGELDLKNLW